VKYARVAQVAISNSQEKTADNFAMATTNDRIFASALAKLMDTKFTERDRDAILKLKAVNAQEFFARVPEQERGPYLGQGHPSLVLRTAAAMSAPNYPAILFADSYFRLLLLESRLRTSSANETDVAEPLAALTADIVASMFKYRLGARYNPRFDKIVQYYALNKRLVLDTIAKLANQQQPNPDAQAAAKAIVAELQASMATNPVLEALEKRMTQELAKIPDGREEHQRAENRLQTLRALMTETDLDQLLSLQKQAGLARSGSEIAARRNLPVQYSNRDVSRIINGCIAALTAKAKAAEAAEPAKATKPE
jgi:hypothetical protein